MVSRGAPVPIPVQGISACTDTGICEICADTATPLPVVNRSVKTCARKVMGKRWPGGCMWPAKLEETIFIADKS